MLGKKHGYYPADPVTTLKIYSSVDAGRDVQEKFWDVLIVLMPGYGEEGDLEEAKLKQAKLLEEYISKTVTKYLTVIQKRLIANISQYPVPDVDEPKQRPSSKSRSKFKDRKSQTASKLAAKHPMYMVGNSVPLADIDSCHLAYTYFMNDMNAYYKETMALLSFPEYA